MKTNPERRFDIHPGAEFMATFGDGQKGCTFNVVIFRVNPLARTATVIEYRSDGCPNWHQGAVGPFRLIDLEYGRYGQLQLTPIISEK